MLTYDDLVAELRKRPLKERLSLLQVLAQSVEEAVAEKIEPQAPVPPITHGARHTNLKDFDRNWRPSPADFEHDLKLHEEAQKLSEEIGKKYPDLKVDAVEWIREDRRF